MDIASCHLDGNADAVEFCPHYPFQHLLAAATYTLTEEIQPCRTGSISLFSTNCESGIELLYQVQTAGVFDIKWSPKESSSPLLAQADADGCLSLLGLAPVTGKQEGAVFNEISAAKISSAMCLCLDWDPSATFISLGLSDGSLSLVAIREAQLEILDSWLAHEYEVWATSYKKDMPHILYSGSDDCRFSCWDLRDSPSNTVFQNYKSHKMGVCCIAQDPVRPNTVLTGSYDEHLRVWDMRSTSKPIEERSLNLGGGVWRLRYHPTKPGLVLAACMHNGFAIVSVEEEDVVIVETYHKHKSLAYGADWQRGEACSLGKLPAVATCSFYDQLLRIWKPECDRLLSCVLNEILASTLL